MNKNIEAGDKVAVEMKHGRHQQTLIGTVVYAAGADGLYCIQLPYTAVFAETIWLPADAFTVTESPAKVARARRMEEKLTDARKALADAVEALREAIDTATADGSTDAVAELETMRDDVKKATLPHIHNHIHAWRVETADRKKTYGTLWAKS